jgi:hypothetical protein
MEGCAMSTALNKFKELSEISLKILNETFDCRKAEPYYVAVLNLVKENPQYREEFIDAFFKCNW